MIPSYSEVIKGLWDRNVLWSVLLELTYRCNLDCFFCYNDLGLRGRPLSTAQYLQLLEDLRALGALNVTLSGGEPLAHPDFMRLGRRARDLGLVVRIKSNGHAITREVARTLKAEVNPMIVDVSLHGGTAATHDRQTRVPGSFERLMGNLAGMREAGLHLKLNAPLTLWNEAEIELMFAIADGLEAPIQFDVEVSPRDDGDRAPLAITASNQGVERLLRIQKQRGRHKGPPPREAPPTGAKAAGPQSSKHCGAGSSALAVDPYGNVYPCVQWRRRIGTLHEQSLEDIWKGSPELGRIREIQKSIKLAMTAGGPGAGLAFCPGNAEAQTGDPQALYPAVVRLAEIAGRARRRHLPVIS